MIAHPKKTKRKEWKAFRIDPNGGPPIPISPPTEDQQRSMDEQQERMFTQDGQSRRVIQIREILMKEMSEKMRKIRLNQPLLTLKQSQEQMENNRLEYGKRIQSNSVKLSTERKGNE